MLDLAREYPFLVPFALLLLPFCATFLILAWLMLLAIRGKAVTVNLKGFGVEIALLTVLSPRSEEIVDDKIQTTRISDP